MNDEIREIFDTKLYFDLEEEDYIKIKNYITNLQQDLEKANDIIAKDRQFYKNRMDEYAELKKENERQSKAQVILDDMLADYKSRVEKAVESLKLKQIRYVNESDYVLDDGDLQEEINILQNGSDDNE